jgi:pimeloyl-ACP methyl ester carboxylesterase
MMCSKLVHSMPRSVSAFLGLLFLLFAIAHSSRIVSAAQPDAPNSSPPIVIGFVGGFISHDNPIHGGVQLAERLRKEYPAQVYVEVFENHRGEQAHQQILRLLDANHDGKLSPEEKQSARIIIYGHSWGGSETVALARELQADGIPVLLTIQVDSVSKIGEDDSLIPANVEQAANFYQLNGYLHGRSEIRAADPARTKILGNIRFDYASKPIRCNGYSWFARAFEKPHIEIECDPNVINRVESLIRSQLSALPLTASSAASQ